MIGQNSPIARPSALEYTYTVSRTSGESLFRARCHEFGGVECHGPDPCDALRSAIEAVQQHIDLVTGRGTVLPPVAGVERSTLAELRPVARLAIETSGTRSGRALSGLIGRECRRYLSMGGTLDELAVELGLALSVVRQLLAQPLSDPE